MGSAQTRFFQNITQSSSVKKNEDRGCSLAEEVHGQFYEREDSPLPAAPQSQA